MLICPDADPTDGLLDVTMVQSASRTKLIRLFPTVFKGTHVDLDEVTHRAGARRSRWTRPASTPTPTASTSARCRSRCRRCRAR